MAKKKLAKSNNAVFAGVLGGIAEYFGWDPTVVRIIFVVISFFSTGFPGILVYLILMLVMPDASSRAYSSNNNSSSSSKKRPRKDVTDSSRKDSDDWSEF
ncbi:PspC domain-containing protein [Agrilactobacillus yilanensis]|uniref:PspC domain-containing protein n=1 Tax=Agrilactobacillus yilanensis TaxID=2485997 RepID=A0ABW4JA35_9LACO|nr:PspC domain-containing protein [Agrilactobacillus yilanensis]